VSAVVARRASALFVAVLLITTDAAVAFSEAPIVVRYVLPNGVTLIVRESGASRVVAASLQVDTGLLVDDTAPAGVTNFLQRVMLRGTARRSASEVVEAAEDLGGVIDATSDADHAEIRGHALARHWDGLLTLMAEIVLMPAITESEIERTRRLVLSQITTRADTPLAFATDALMRELYGTHPYARQSYGTTDSVKSLTRETLVAHYRRLYQPARLVVAVSGDVRRELVQKRVERLFGKMPASPRVEGRSSVAPKPTHVRRVVERAAQQAQILVGYIGPAVAEEDYATVKVLAALLGGGTAARFFAELRERRGLAYSLGVLNPTRRGPSAFICYMSTTVSNVESGEAAMRHEIERVRADAPTPGELERAKNYVLGTLAMDRRTNARHAWYLAFFEVLDVGWNFPARYAARVQAVTPDMVLAAARRYLDAPTTIVLQPPPA
jgi:zinc protease